MGRSFDLHLAQDADIDWIVARHRTVYSEEFALSATFGDRVVTMMAALRARETGFVRMVVATVDGARAGFICVSDLPEGGAFLNFVWVEPDFRRRGVAEALMADALDYARAQNCTFVRLRTFSVLTGARHLYDRLGFVIDEIEKDSTEFGPVFDIEYWQMAL